MSNFNPDLNPNNNSADRDYVEDLDQSDRILKIPARHQEAATGVGAPVTRAQHRTAAYAAGTLTAEMIFSAPIMTAAQCSNLFIRTGTYCPKSIDHSSFCQRCFLRLQENPDHRCVLIQGHKACQWCARVHQRCIQVPEEYNDLVRTALGLSGAAQAQAIADVRQRIRTRTRHLNQEARERAAANGQAAPAEQAQEE